MTLKTPLWQENSSFSATVDRELIDALFSVAGILTSTDLAVTQRAAGANMSVDIAAGRCVVTGTDQTGQGKYLCKSDAVTNVTIATAPGTGQSRIDLIVAAVRDGDQNGGANNDWVIEAVTGTPAATGSQVVPAAPASSLILARVAVGPNVTTIVTANVTDERTTATIGPAGGVLGYTQYPTAHTYTCPGTSLTAYDATNLAVTFVAPASGAVKVKQSGFVQYDATVSTLMQLNWGLLNASGGAQLGLTFGVQTWRNAAATLDIVGQYVSISQKITGLTPGTTYTLNWAASGTDTTANTPELLTGVGSGAAPAVMEVTAA